MTKRVFESEEILDLAREEQIEIFFADEKEKEKEKEKEDKDKERGGKADA